MFKAILNPATKYPCLKQGVYGAVVLFTSPNTGVKLTDNYPGSPIYAHGLRFTSKVGDNLDTWAESTFKPYTNTVTISN